ncbi:32637_t:CDS:2, partial [Gigaspora margarita]
QVAETLDYLTCCRALEHIWLELEAWAISLAWAHLKDETRAVIILRDLCMTVLRKMRQEQLRAQQDYIRGLSIDARIPGRFLQRNMEQKKCDLVNELIYKNPQGRKKTERQNQIAELEYLENSKRKTHQNQKACV